jgi:non-lysosomal glucosylceramidase
MTWRWSEALLFCVSLLLSCPFVSQRVLAQADYGAADANSRSATTASGDGATYDYLNLHDQVGPSGVPLGGMGVGEVNLSPDGRFTRFGINNWATDNGVGRAKEENPNWDREAFAAVWERDSQAHVAVRRLVRGAEAAYGMSGYSHSSYRGLFPTARVSFDDDRMPQPHSLASLYAYSGLVPHDVKDSSLPGFWVEITLANSDSQSVEVAVALSWPDVLGRGVYDIKDLDDARKEETPFTGYPMAPIAHGRSEVEALRLSKYRGVRQFLSEPLKPKKLTFQNYVNEVALLAESGSDRSISVLPSWNVTGGTSAWSEFRRSGELGGSIASETLSGASAEAGASALAIKTKLGAGEKKTFRFLVSWNMPKVQLDWRSADPRSYSGKADYDRYFQNFFPDLKMLLGYEIANRERILQETLAWQQPILESTLPDWLKFKLINSAYTLYTNTILNKAGEFTVMEGGMGGLAGTMDQRLSAHPVYGKSFPELDYAELQQFADTQDTDGGILHFDGHYFIGIADPEGGTPTPHSKLVDNTASWLIQVAENYQQSGDRSFAKRNADHIRRAFVYLHQQIQGTGQIPLGGQTYDDYPHPPVSSYMATVYLASLRAGQVLAHALDDRTMDAECRSQFDKTQAGLVKMLWNGRFFAYGADEDGSARRDDRVFTGQLAGQFISRESGWGNIVPWDMVRSSLETQLKTSVAHTPDFYAPKIWDLEMARGVDMPGSRCWPFYLESYTAMAAIQAGFLSDGLEIMRHIQLVHLRHGWTWSQNLWNPGELTYMTAPVTWFITDVLTGFSYDADVGQLVLGLTTLPGQERTVIPLYSPRFWAELEYEPGKHRASLHITKVFGGKKIIFRSLRGEPLGMPANTGEMMAIPAFEVREGNSLDLSPYLLSLARGELQRPVLP